MGVRELSLRGELVSTPGILSAIKVARFPITMQNEQKPRPSPRIAGNSYSILERGRVQADDEVFKLAALALGLFLSTA